MLCGGFYYEKFGIESEMLTVNPWLRIGENNEKTID
jgi:hypothetical protein